MSSNFFYLAALLGNKIIELEGDLDVFLIDQLVKGKIMHPNLSIPTDNLYKFVAITGLVILITSMVLYIAAYSAGQKNSYEIIAELIKLEEIKNPSDSQKKIHDYLNERLKINISNQSFYANALSVFMMIAIGLMIFGFKGWYTKYQLVEDSIQEKRLKKIENEIRALQKRSYRK